jgi:hypothetical protein
VLGKFLLELLFALVLHDCDQSFPAFAVVEDIFIARVFGLRSRRLGGYGTQMVVFPHGEGEEGLHFGPLIAALAASEAGRNAAAS